MLSKPIACPKPPSRLQDRIAYKRDREARARAFRKAVWERDKGQCRICKKPVVKGSWEIHWRGEVHHLRGRNVAPEDRYNVNKAILVCAFDHGRLTRHEIEFRGTP